MRPTLVRASQRHAMRRAVRIDCQVVRSRDFKLLGARALDLSTKGMLVETDINVLTGEDVLVTFRAPRTHQWFDCEAIVARVLHGRRPGDRGQCLGLSFETLDEWSRVMLRNDLHGLPPPIPKRAPRIDYAASVLRASL
jgi:hypothetical protein